MAKVILRKSNLQRRKLRVRKKVFGTPQRPRLSVHKTNKYTYGQIIDDTSGKTLVGVSLNEIREIHEGKPKIEAANEVGKLLAKEAKAAKIEGVVFDRSGFRYHGRIKSVADGAREGGLEL